MFGRSLRAVLITALCLFLTGGPMATAENDNTRYQVLTNRPPSFRLFRDPVPQVVPQVRRMPQVRRVAPSTVIIADTPAKPKVEATTFVAVLGDSMADLLANGLGDAFADTPEVAVLRKAKADTGLVRSDFYDWPKAVTDLLASPEKVSFAVMLLGANDRQVLKDGAANTDPLTDRWKELYAQRVDAIIKAFGDRKIPLVWVGLPPMKSDRMSEDMIALNDLYRDHVQRQGGIYVDLWDAFVDDDSAFAAMGPDVNGQIVRLRTADGVHFTKAGARKAAHFVELELRKLMDMAGPSAVVAVTSPVDAPVPADQPILPDGVAPVPTKPVAGPILPLTRVEVSPGGALIADGTRSFGPKEATAALDRLFVEGRVPEPVPGRADDFRWPRAMP